ncbi:MAG: hypothetical protein DRR06_18370 [Gammaproteobacteria bacterium]|nr:MAG: hypothetical protein DRR06_18370 [Gammaproteobacteria bacterium]
MSQGSFAATKQLYLDSLNATPVLTRVIPSANTTLSLTSGSSVDIDQSPFFQSSFSISENDISVSLTLQKTGPGSSRTAHVELFINGSGGVSIGSDSFSWTSGGPTAIPFTISNASVINFSAGDYLTLVVTNSGSGTFRVRADAGGASLVELDTNTVINVDAIGIHSIAYPDPTEYLSYVAGDGVFLRATVSDPFGFADISSVDFTVNDPDSPPSVFTVNLTIPESGASGAIAVFETPYPIQAAPAPDGVWSVDVVANEGVEGVTDSKSKTFSVGSTDISVEKTSATTSDPVNITSPKAIPNSHIEYTVETINSGFGFADNNSIYITDPLPDTQTTFYFGAASAPFNPVQFADGVNASGLTYTFVNLSDQTDDVQFYSDTGCSIDVLVPVTDASGYDISSPKVICIAVNPKGDFNGSDGSNHPSFFVRFTVRVD